MEEPSVRSTLEAGRRSAFDRVAALATELGWLAGVTSTGSDADSAAALDAILDQAARPRRAVDPEDADEIADGCQTLLALARAPGRPRTRRVGAIRALRMLAERGCAKAADIPTDLDGKVEK